MNLKPLLGIIAATTLGSTLWSAAPSTVAMREFGQTKAGEPVMLYTLTNANGLTTDITNYGGIMTRLFVPDSSGKLGDILLGFNTVDEYIAKTPYFGALIGRVGNRIAHGKFTLDGKTYTLALNDKPGEIPCNLHGGIAGFDKVLWQAEPVIKDNAPGLKLHRVSPDGEEGFPGNLDVTVTYWLTNANELKIEYRATTDKATPINLTQHNYYNLRGDGNGDILGHLLTINGSKTTPVNAGLIPTGELAPVAGTPFDFLTPTAMGKNINADNQQIKYGPGFDHNWVLDRKTAKDLELAATVYEPTTGRVMEVWTQEPDLQFYAGNFLDGTLVGKNGKTYQYRTGFCLETQHAPDSINQPKFPSTVLRPGEVYSTVTVYRFSAK
ncbi:MAG: galactose mutarotase [Opitutaceae bacterium]|nr:galactose mutarotase [Opitutaceae bacterium]